jgi:hypothetical protein
LLLLLVGMVAMLVVVMAAVGLLVVWVTAGGVGMVCTLTMEPCQG